MNKDYRRMDSRDAYELKSKNANMPSKVRFVCKSSRRAELIWKNYQGEDVSYGVFNYGQYTRMNTYVTHPWICRDADTGDRLLLSGRVVFLPPPPPDDYDYDDDDDEEAEVTVHMHIPVYNLKHLCLQHVKQHWTDSQIQGLELPVCVKKKLLSGKDFDIP